jgi:hypothetical protein
LKPGFTGCLCNGLSKSGDREKEKSYEVAHTHSWGIFVQFV